MISNSIGSLEKYLLGCFCNMLNVTWEVQGTSICILEGAKIISNESIHNPLSSKITILCCTYGCTLIINGNVCIVDHGSRH